MKFPVAPATAIAFLVGIGLATAGTATAVQMITGKQIRNGTITAKDLSKGVRRQLGVAGPTGATGPTGPAGTFAQVVNRRFEKIAGATPPGGVDVLFGTCQPGERALSAGFTSGGTATDFLVHRSLPTAGSQMAADGKTNPDGWLIVFSLKTGQSVYLNRHSALLGGDFWVI